VKAADAVRVLPASSLYRTSHLTST